MRADINTGYSSITKVTDGTTTFENSFEYTGSNATIFGTTQSTAAGLIVSGAGGATVTIGGVAVSNFPPTNTFIPGEVTQVNASATDYVFVFKK